MVIILSLTIIGILQWRNRIKAAKERKQSKYIWDEEGNYIENPEYRESEKKNYILKEFIKANFDLPIFNNLPDEFKIENHEPTEREIEKALRDVGLSLHEAQAFLAGRRENKSIEGIAELIKKNTELFGGKIL